MGKRTCGQYYEPFISDPILSSESYPGYSPYFSNNNLPFDTLIYVGPPRDGRRRRYANMVKLRAFSSKTRIRDVINSYMFYSKIEYESAADFTISYNDKTVNLKDRTSCTLGGLFEKNYVTISSSVISRVGRVYTQP